MITYEFLQQYWWFLIALLGGLLVFLLFVQGGNALIFLAGNTEDQRQLIINSTGRKWELTFTTLVTFGGAFFASFPLFYSTSFGGAYWLWTFILITFVLQAVSYEFQGKVGNILGTDTFRAFLTLNGCMAPFLIGMAVGTFFTGADFVVNKDAVANLSDPAISQWVSVYGGMEALAHPFNVALGMTLVFLSIILGALYLLNNIDHKPLEAQVRLGLKVIFVGFLGMLVIMLILLFTIEGYAVSESGVVSKVKFKYLYNFIEMPAVVVMFLVGAGLLVTGVVRTLRSTEYKRGIWFCGPGTVLVVMSLFFLAGYNGTAYYPSTVDIQSSLTLANSSSSEFTLRAMSIVSLVIPFVVAYIAYFWRKMDLTSLTKKELETEDKY